jgi:hypothetical protein
MATIMYNGKNYKVPNGTIRITDDTVEINSKCIDQYPTISTKDFINEGLSRFIMSILAIITIGVFSFNAFVS